MGRPVWAQEMDDRYLNEMNGLYHGLYILLTDIPKAPILVSKARYWANRKMSYA